MQSRSARAGAGGGGAGAPTSIISSTNSRSFLLKSPPTTPAAAPSPRCRHRHRADPRRERVPPAAAASASSSSSSSSAQGSYRCSKCGARPSQPMGRCPVCREWGTVERVIQPAFASSAAAAGGGGDGLAAARRAVAAANANANAKTARPPPPPHPTSSDADALANSTFLEFDAQGEPVLSAPRVSAGWLVRDDDDDDAGDDAVPESLAEISRRRRREAAAAGGGSGGASSSPFSSPTRLPLPTATGAEIARVLGGGLVPGSVVLVGGDPGVGKSTLLLQAASLVARACCGDDGQAASASSSSLRPPPDQVGRPVLYVSAEESKEQLWMRAVRLGLVPGEGGEGEGEGDNNPHHHQAAGDLRLVSENRLEAVLSSIAALRPSLVIVDSVQTVLLSGLDHRPGSVAQVRECATALLHAAKRLRTAVLLVGHVTKGGDLAGPKSLEHLVDAVVYLEGGVGGGGGGGGGGQYRLLRAQKNRHGSVGEVAILRHGPRGLEAVDDYRSLFVSAAAFDGAEEEEEEEENEDGEGGPLSSPSSSLSAAAAAAVGAGSALTIVQEGRRALVIEVQALVAGRGGEGGGARSAGDYNSDNDEEDEEEDDEFGGGRRAGRWRGGGASSSSSSSSSSSAPLYRAAVGFASRERLPLLLEVLAKHGACAPARAARRSHVFASVAGGYRTRPGETATDLALCAALVSSALGARLPRRTAVLGEVGLAGELRPVPELEARLREAAAMGFERVVVPSANDGPIVAAASSPSPDGRRPRPKARRAGGGGGGGAAAAPRALDGLRKELGGGMEVVSVPTLRAALRYLFGERLRAAAGRRQQGQRQRRRGGRGAAAGEEEEEAALVASALAAARGGNPLSL